MLFSVWVTLTEHKWVTFGERRGQGDCYPAYRAVNHYVYERVRVFLRRRHKVPSLGTAQFSDRVVFGKLGVLRLFVAKPSVS
jgi:hypothetical protein